APTNRAAPRSRASSSADRSRTRTGRHSGRNSAGHSSARRRADDAARDVGPPQEGQPQRQAPPRGGVGSFREQRASRAAVDGIVPSDYFAVLAARARRSSSVG